jgi:transposase
MRRYSEAVKADVKRRMSPPHYQSVARISEELGIQVMTLYKWRSTRSGVETPRRRIIRLIAHR